MMMGLSADDKYITLIEKKEKNLYQLNVIELSSLSTKLEFEYRQFNREAWPLIHFNADDSVAYRVN